MQSLVFFMGMVVNVKIKIVKFEQVIDEDGSLFLFWTVEQTLRVDLSSFASCTCTTRQTINPSRVVNYCIYANAIKFFFVNSALMKISHYTLPACSQLWFTYDIMICTCC